MRLTPLEIAVFVDILSTLLRSQSAALYLYGSRVNDLLKGGDIDLVLILSSPEQASHLSKSRASLLRQFKDKLGDRRIDFSVISEKELASDTFFSDIKTVGILLKQW